MPNFYQWTTCILNEVFEKLNLRFHAFYVELTCIGRKLFTEQSSTNSLVDIYNNKNTSNMQVDLKVLL